MKTVKHLFPEEIIKKAANQFAISLGYQGLPDSEAVETRLQTLYDLLKSQARNTSIFPELETIFLYNQNDDQRYQAELLEIKMTGMHTELSLIFHTELGFTHMSYIRFFASVKPENNSDDFIGYLGLNWDFRKTDKIEGIFFESAISGEAERSIFSFLTFIFKSLPSLEESFYRSTNQTVVLIRNSFQR